MSTCGPIRWRRQIQIIMAESSRKLCFRHPLRLYQRYLWSLSTVGVVWYKHGEIEMRISCLYGLFQMKVLPALYNKVLCRVGVGLITLLLMRPLWLTQNNDVLPKCHKIGCTSKVTTTSQCSLRMTEYQTLSVCRNCFLSSFSQNVCLGFIVSLGRSLAIEWHPSDLWPPINLHTAYIRQVP